MTKRRSVLLTAILTSEVVGFVFVSAWSDRQPTRTLPHNPAFVAGARDGGVEITGTNLLSGPAHETVGLTNVFFVASRFGLALSGWPGPAGEVARARTVSFIELPDGARFIGDVSGGLPNGWGIFNQSNGTRLAGQWRNGIPYRLSGMAVYADGTVENGTWDYAMGVGSGTISWRDGRVYTGGWRNDPGSSELPEGKGTMTWPDGHTYVGRFRNGKMHGQGKITYPNGQVVEGLWGHGEFLVARR